MGIGRLVLSCSLASAGGLLLSTSVLPSSTINLRPDQLHCLRDAAPFISQNTRGGGAGFAGFRTQHAFQEINIHGMMPLLHP